MSQTGYRYNNSKIAKPADIDPSLYISDLNKRGIPKFSAFTSDFINKNDFNNKRVKTDGLKKFNSDTSQAQEKSVSYRIPKIKMSKIISKDEIIKDQKQKKEMVHQTDNKSTYNIDSLPIPRPIMFKDTETIEKQTNSVKRKRGRPKKKVDSESYSSTITIKKVPLKNNPNQNNDIDIGNQDKERHFIKQFENNSLNHINLPADKTKSNPIENQSDLPIKSKEHENMIPIIPETIPIVRRRIEKEYECGICYVVIDFDDKIWSCMHCQTVHHYECCKRFYKSKKNFSCFMCRNVYKTKISSTCYCGKEKTTKKMGITGVHSCGKKCGKKINENNEVCQLICHVGKCNEISQERDILVTDNTICKENLSRIRRNGGCGKIVKCGGHYCLSLKHDDIECIQCGEAKIEQCECGESYYKGCTEDSSCKKKCNKLLACGNHYCTKTCHRDECLPCFQKEIQCVCGKSTKVLNCKGLKKRGFYFCDKKCGRMKDCKQHTCDLICHDGDCEPCSEIISKTCKTCNKSFDTPCGSEIDCFVCNKEELLKLVKFIC